MAEPPFFFVVGCPRSGTTLLRLMLDSHPRLAVPAESYFIPTFAPRPHAPIDVPRLLDRVLAERHVARWQADPARLRSAVVRAAPRTYPELVRALYAAYADEHGKARAGDKTPLYAVQIGQLDRLFPDAVFVHAIRDGREVAASWWRFDWGPRTVVEAASEWARMVRVARRSGRRLGPARYLEVRLEHLIAEPERELRRVCNLIGEDYAPAMLDYHRTAGERLETGKVGALGRPPTAGLRDWRDGLSPREQAAVEAGAGSMLRELGYPVTAPSAFARADAAAARLRADARQLPDRIRWTVRRSLRSGRLNPR